MSTFTSICTSIFLCCTVTVERFCWHDSLTFCDIYLAHASLYKQNNSCAYNLPALMMRPLNWSDAREVSPPKLTLSMPPNIAAVLTPPPSALEGDGWDEDVRRGGGGDEGEAYRFVFTPSLLLLFVSCRPSLALLINEYPVASSDCFLSLKTTQEKLPITIKTAYRRFSAVLSLSNRQRRRCTDVKSIVSTFV